MVRFYIHTNLEDSNIREALTSPFKTLSFSDELYVSIDGQSYPNDSWEDFVIPVITWWLDDMATLLKERCVVCEFMDDAYKIRLQFSDNQETLLVTCYHGGSGENYLEDIPVGLRNYVNEVLRVARDLIQYINRVSSQDELMSCSDYESLNENLSYLESEWTRYNTSKIL